MTEKQQKENFIKYINNQGLSFQTMRRGQFVEVKTPEDYNRNYRLVCNQGAKLPMLAHKFKVVIDPVNEELTEKWQKLQLAVAGINFNGERTEIGFFMLAEEQEDGYIIVKDIKFETTGIGRVSHKNESEIFAMAEDLKQEAARNGNKPFFIFGHTHPAQRGLPNYMANSWSLGDYYSCMRASDAMNEIGVQAGDLVITPSLDTNIMFFDRGTHKFYRFQEGVCCLDKGKPQSTTCYSDPDAEPIKYDLRNLDR